MTNLQLSLQRACNELGLNIIVPFSLTMQQGKYIQAQALIPQLGVSKGLIVVCSYDDLCGMADDILSSGYSYSVLDDPLPTEEFFLEDYKEMFSDWGWSGPVHERPTWIEGDFESDVHNEL